MRFEDFQKFLDEHEVSYKDVGNRILLQECFECGYTKYKTSFRPSEKESRVLWGRCFKCDASFSSYRYLVDLGFDPKVVRALHNFDTFQSTDDGRGDTAEFLAVLQLDEEKHETAASKQEYRPAGVSVEGMFSLDGWPEHPAAQYAKSRGVPSGLNRHIRIDPVANAVVFLCWEGDKIVGWQKRFVNPPRPNFKTQNPPADQFKKSMHVMEYPNAGPIAVCEGGFSGVSAWCFGYHAIVTFGSAISKAQLEKIEAIAVHTGKPIYVSFDLDPAGFKGFFKIKNYFERRGVPVQRLEPEVGNDLNDSWQAGRRGRVVEDDPYDSSVPVLDVFSDIYRGN